MAPGSVSALNDEDKLSLWVGRVAREHALLEYALSNVHRLLDVSDDEAPSSVGGLILECRKLLKRSDLSTEIVQAGCEALTAASAATAIRNRIVHDMWLPDPLHSESEAARWNAFRRSAERTVSYIGGTVKDLETVVEAYTNLARSRSRVSGLFMALHEVMRSSVVDERPKTTSELPRYIAMMEDRFTVDANGDIDVCLSRGDQA
jgi:hypothetical protein